jgi:hypothetical protein
VLIHTGPRRLDGPASLAQVVERILVVEDFDDRAVES